MKTLRPTAGQSTEGSSPEVIHELAVALGKAALALGKAGHPAQANRIVAGAYSSLWREDEGPAADAARRLNGVMHSLSRMPDRSFTDQSNPKEKKNMSVTPLDVRAEPPARRHELIFETFGKLDAGDGFELINDHDPKPLYYQLEAEETGRFSWEYLEQGPEVWRVEIGRTS